MPNLILLVQVGPSWESVSILEAIILVEHCISIFLGCTVVQFFQQIRDCCDCQGVAKSSSLARQRLMWLHAPVPTSSKAKYVFPVGTQTRRYTYVLRTSTWIVTQISTDRRAHTSNTFISPLVDQNEGLVDRRKKKYVYVYIHTCPQFGSLPQLGLDNLPSSWH